MPSFAQSMSLVHGSSHGTGRSGSVADWHADLANGSPRLSRASGQVPSLPSPQHVVRHIVPFGNCGSGSSATWQIRPSLQACSGPLHGP